VEASAKLIVLLVSGAGITLYRSKQCGSFFEVTDEDRSIRFPRIDELRRHYPKVIHE
jgi:hypothetical protein